MQKLERQKPIAKGRATGGKLRAGLVFCLACCVASLALGGVVREVDAVCAAAYRADDGEEAVVFANATWEEQNVEFLWNGTRKTIAIAPGGIRITTTINQGSRL